MRAVFAASAAVSALCFAASAAMALGLGPVVNATRLGQPLDFSVVVKLDTEETLAPQCVLAEVMAGDNRLPPAQVHARLLRSPRAGEAIARITTTVRLSEPVVAVTVSLGCPPRLSHKFVSLLDPPTSAAVRAVPAPHADTLKPAAPVVAASEAAIVPSPADAEQRAREREQLLVLEERLERQRLDNVATQQSVMALQARLRESEQARRDNPAIYGLTTLVVLLLSTIAVLLWRVMRLQSQRTADAEAHGLSDFLDGARPQHTLPVTPPFDEATMTSMRVLSSQDTIAQEPLTAVRETAQTTIPAAVRVRHQLSAEELIDLEQQADFFVAIGQEDAAIDLLMGHVRSSGGTSPMPYLKLLEIYRRRSDGDAYERIRERFNRRFNGHAPAWETDPRHARSLEAYPEIVSRLQAAWKTPAQGLDLVESLLFRRDSSDETFELRAYEELLFLYAIVRDIVEHITNPDGVDLLLPLGDDDDPPAIERAEVSRVPQARLPEAPSVDFELDLDSPRRSRI